MAYQPKVGGRKSREYINEAQADLTQARNRLYEMIGSTNAIQAQRALRDAMPYLDSMAYLLRELEAWHALEAKRGSYKENDSDGNH